MSIMYSIRKRICLGTIPALLLAVGCTPKQTVFIHDPASVADQPQADEATRLRGYPRMVASYQNGATEAWPTRWYYTTNSEFGTPVNFVADPFMFLMQVGSVPVTMTLEPPFQTAVVYGSDVLPGSYTAMPP